MDLIRLFLPSLLTVFPCRMSFCELILLGTAGKFKSRCFVRLKMSLLLILSYWQLIQTWKLRMKCFWNQDLRTVCLLLQMRNQTLGLVQLQATREPMPNVVQRICNFLGNLFVHELAQGSLVSGKRFYRDFGKARKGMHRSVLRCPNTQLSSLQWGATVLKGGPQWSCICGWCITVQRSPCQLILTIHFRSPLPKVWRLPSLNQLMVLVLMVMKFQGAWMPSWQACTRTTVI